MNRREARRVRYAVEQGKDLARIKRKGMPIRDFLDMIEHYMRRSDRALLREVIRREGQR